VQPSARSLPSRWLAGAIFVAITAACDQSPLTRPGLDAGVVTDTASVSAQEPGKDAPPPDQATVLMLPDVPGRDTNVPCTVESLGSAAMSAVRGGVQCDILSTRPSDKPDYAVVIDSEGRAVELIHPSDKSPVLTGATRQAWLEAMSSTRWPCLAGQSVTFACVVLLI
jgi:hypothetical protein